MLIMSDNTHQFLLPFDDVAEPVDIPALWTPRDIWVHLNQRSLKFFAEGRRIDFKTANNKIDIEDLAIWYSMFSNTTDGDVLVFGVDSNGVTHGCSRLNETVLNRIQNFHLQHCPQAKPEFRKFPVVIENRQDFCLAVFLPYVGKLVETNKEEAWIRYGDERHKMVDEEKRDFRSTREQHAFERDLSSLKYPDDFDIRIVQDFCDKFRQREAHPDWTNEAVLEDRMLGKPVAGHFVGFNSLTLLAGKKPGMVIPGCRVRIIRFRNIDNNFGDNYNPILDATVEGNVVTMIEGAIKIIEDTIYPVTWLNKDAKFVTTPEYPKYAWFESLVNALVHRSYSFSGSDVFVRFFPDRLEIESPGGFVPPVTENRIYSARAARNHYLMDALRYIGYVQMAREGTKRIRESMKESNLPDPSFKQEAVHGVIVKVTLWNDHLTRKRATDLDVANFFGVEAWKKMQEHELKIMAFAYRNKTVQVSDAGRLTGRTWHTSKKDLTRLVNQGLLSFVEGQYERDYKAHYALVERQKPE